MANSAITKAYGKGIRALAKIKHKKQGEPIDIGLMSNNSDTLELEVFTTITLAGHKTKESVGFGVWVESFQISEPAMTLDDKARCVAVLWNGTEYKVAKIEPPTGLQRYWLITIQPANASE